MTEYALLYGAKDVTIGAEWVEANAEGAVVGWKPASEYASETFTLRWDDESLIVRGTMDADHLANQVDDLRDDCEEGEGDTARVMEALDRCRVLLHLMAPEGLSAAGRALSWMRSQQRALDGLLVWNDRVEDADGALIATLPPEDYDDEVPPPDAERVARRARVLTALVARTMIEQLPPEQGELSHLWEWMDAHALWEEAEREERNLIRTDRGKLPMQAVVNGSWRSEGLAVLAWALGLYELPPHDTQADPEELAGLLGIFAGEVPTPLMPPTLRAPEELAAMGGRLLGIHWRQRDFSLRPAAMDFPAFAADCWFGSFSLEGVALAGGDLAIAGSPIADAKQEAVGLTMSIAMERHQAINWLQGFGRRYSKVDTST